MEEQTNTEKAQQILQPPVFIPTAHLSYVHRKPYPSVGAAFGLLGIMLGISGIAGVVAGIVSTFNSHVFSFAVFVAYLVSLGVTLFLGIAFRKHAEFSFKAGPAFLWPLLLIFTLAFVVIREPFFYILPRFFDYNGPYNQGEDSGIFSFILVVIAAPILEELVFRGIILDGFLKRYKPLSAIIFSAMIFGIAHLHPLMVINAFMIGLMVGWIYYKTKSLFLCIFVHFVNNLMVTVMEYFTPYNDVIATRQIIGNDWLYAGVYAACTLLAGFLFLVMWMLMRKRKESFSEVTPLPEM